MVRAPPWIGRRDLKLEETLRGLILSRSPEQVAILAPAVPPAYGQPPGRASYYALNIAELKIPPKVVNMIRRASKGLKITRQRTVDTKHLGLIGNFSESHPVDPDSRTLSKTQLLEAARTAVVFSARTEDGSLVAFDIADFWANGSAFLYVQFPVPPFFVPRHLGSPSPRDHGQSNGSSREIRVDLVGN